jgi:hypothetical protein
MPSILSGLKRTVVYIALAVAMAMGVPCRVLASDPPTPDELAWYVQNCYVLDEYDMDWKPGYDPSTHGCCNGEVFSLNEQCCVNGVVVDKDPECIGRCQSSRDARRTAIDTAYAVAIARCGLSVPCQLGAAAIYMTAVNANNVAYDNCCAGCACP